MPLAPVGFDLDMTLVDSGAGIAATVRATLAEQGLTVSEEQVFALNGVPMEETMAALAPSLDPLAATARYRELYPVLGVPRTVLLPGAADALAAVRAFGGRVVVVSTKVETAVRLVLDQVGLLVGRDVDEVHGGLFAQAKGVRLRELGAGVYVGDHPGDVRAAQVAGAVAVAVASGPHSAGQLQAAGADVVLPDLLGFPGWLAARVAAA